MAAPTPERRFARLRQAGRTLTGDAILYGEVARLPWGEERFEAGAFGADVSAADVTLNVLHDRGRPIARTGGGGLVLTDGPGALAMAAELPDTREAADTLALVRAGVLRGLSIEFHATQERQDGSLRVVERADLVGLAVVDRPAYLSSTVTARRRPEGRAAGISATIPYDTTLDCKCHRGACDRVRFEAGAFELDIGAEVLAVIGDYARAVASRSRGTLKLTDTPGGLQVAIPELPDTEAVRDLLALGGAVPLVVRPFWRAGDAEFEEAGEGAAAVATYRRAPLRAVIIGATDQGGGWPEAAIDGDAPPRRRRLWL